MTEGVAMHLDRPIDQPRRRHADRQERRPDGEGHDAAARHRLATDHLDRREREPGHQEPDPVLHPDRRQRQVGGRLEVDDPRDREDKTTGLSPAAIAVGVGAAALVWLALDALKRFL